MTQSPLHQRVSAQGVHGSPLLPPELESGVRPGDAGEPWPERGRRDAGAPRTTTKGRRDGAATEKAGDVGTRQSDEATGGSGDEHVQRVAEGAEGAAGGRTRPGSPTRYMRKAFGQVCSVNMDILERTST